MSVIFAAETEVTASETVVPIMIVRSNDWLELKDELTDSERNLAAVHRFEGRADQVLYLVNDQGQTSAILFGAGDAPSDILGPIRAGGLSSTLKKGFYRFVRLPDDWSADLAAVGWGVGAYKFERYLSQKTNFPVLVLDTPKLDEIRSVVSSVHLCRDLINTPASDMGPEALHKAAVKLAEEYSAKVSVIQGEALLERNLPMIHAVGRAAHEVPRLVEFEWGDPSHPRLALIGKGITFDTGGVNIKSAAGARIMKKDMGGAAHALTLSIMILANN